MFATEGWSMGSVPWADQYVISAIHVTRTATRSARSDERIGAEDRSPGYEPASARATTREKPPGGRRCELACGRAPAVRWCRDRRRSRAESQPECAARPAQSD